MTVRRLGAACVAVALLTLTACGGGDGGDALAKKDPQGAKACTALADAFRAKDDQAAAIAGVQKAGEAAHDATTDAIRGAYIDLAGTPAADAQKLHDACVDAGVSMPDVPSGS